jgi:hypothetical protein
METPVVPYLLRLYVLMTQPFSVCLHWINSRDPDNDPHDHQRAFVSLVLRGWYREEVYRPVDGPGRLVWRDEPEVRLVRWINFKRSTDVHRIIEVGPRTLTLVLNGPRKKLWHFFIDGRFYLGNRATRQPIEWNRYENKARASS